MCSDYCFDVVLTIPRNCIEDLPDTPEPIVEFLADTYINDFRFKPTDPIISKQQMDNYLKDNAIDITKYTLIERPKVQEYEALIYGDQMYRIHWIISCDYDEEKCSIKIPSEALTFIESVYDTIHENNLSTLEIMHDTTQWKDSWIHKKISYPEFRAHALCNRADDFFDNIDRDIDNKINEGISKVRTQLNKQLDAFRTSMFQQHTSLITDMKRFEERVNKRIGKFIVTEEFQDVTQQLKKIDEDNKRLTKSNRNYKFYLVYITLMQAIIVGLVFARELGYI